MTILDILHRLFAPEIFSYRNELHFLSNNPASRTFAIRELCTYTFLLLGSCRVEVVFIFEKKLIHCCDSLTGTDLYGFPEILCNKIFSSSYRLQEIASEGKVCRNCCRKYATGSM